MKNYDLIVVGSGAGLIVLQVALMKGLKCAVIEKGKFGGTCLTRGCIPSKMLVHPADMIREAQGGEKIGLSFEKPKFDWEIISKRTWSQINYSQEIEH
ncbi:MAG TPA: dihydrolipoamide dehydrogenase, partial [Oscillospiraceae bacterium]|nr:dihydrolipoamide dehydrogenase [Oscillospiraceae bacterium]